MSPCFLILGFLCLQCVWLVGIIADLRARSGASDGRVPRWAAKSESQSFDLLLASRPDVPKRLKKVTAQPTEVMRFPYESQPLSLAPAVHNSGSAERLCPETKRNEHIVLDCDCKNLKVSLHHCRKNSKVDLKFTPSDSPPFLFTRIFCRPILTQC